MKTARSYYAPLNAVLMQATGKVMLEEERFEAYGEI